jgi:hypothetical protein
VHLRLCLRRAVGKLDPITVGAMKPLGHGPDDDLLTSSVRESHLANAEPIVLVMCDTQVDQAEADADAGSNLRSGALDGHENENTEADENGVRPFQYSALCPLRSMGRDGLDHARLGLGAQSQTDRRSKSSSGSGDEFGEVRDGLSWRKVLKNHYHEWLGDNNR